MTGRGIDICRQCHSFLHKKFPEKVLGRELNTVEKILENETMRAYLAWAGKNRANRQANFQDQVSSVRVLSRSRYD